MHEMTLMVHPAYHLDALEVQTVCLYFIKFHVFQLWSRPANKEHDKTRLDLTLPTNQPSLPRNAITRT